MLIDTTSCYILGDIHGEWTGLNTFINKKRPSAIIQVGDFGFWPKFDNKTTLGQRVMTSHGIKKKIWRQCGMKMQDTPLFWCDGNHEDHWALKELIVEDLEADTHTICPNVYYVPRGKILKTTCGKNILFLGGADSIDKSVRTLGTDWFPEEIIDQQTIYNLPDEPVDIVISHTCPTEFLSEVLPYNTYKNTDPCYEALSYVLHKYKPSLWFFGHFHVHKEGRYHNTHWRCLNMAACRGWFAKLNLT